MKRGGLAKLTEECGEVVQVCAKADQVDGLDNAHWSGSLRAMLELELGDLYAAMAFVIDTHKLNLTRIQMQRDEKLRLFNLWENES